MQDLSKNSESGLPSEHETNVKETTLFVETLNYLLKVIYKNYTSDSVTTLVKWYLQKNEYDYEQAKKQLFADLAAELRKSCEESITQS